jgi:hypothetical protein
MAWAECNSEYKNIDKNISKMYQISVLYKTIPDYFISRTVSLPDMPESPWENPLPWRFRLTFRVAGE